MPRRRSAFRSWTLFAFALGTATTAHAGLFNMPHFLTSEQMSFGLEPEFTFSHGAGLAGNFKFTKGLTDFSNGTFAIGTGDGNRRFRIGGNLTFDFIPDLEDQPGIGIALQTYYYTMSVPGSRLEAQAVPYLSKTITSEGGTTITPFIGFPIGIGFQSDRTQTISSLAVGAITKATDTFSYVLELGIAVQNTDSYFSGGVVFTP